MLWDNAKTTVKEFQCYHVRSIYKVARDFILDVTDSNSAI